MLRTDGQCKVKSSFDNKAKFPGKPAWQLATQKWVQGYLSFIEH